MESCKGKNGTAMESFTRKNGTFDGKFQKKEFGKNWKDWTIAAIGFLEFSYAK